MQNKKLITVKEFANEYGIGTNKAYEMVNSKGFPVVKLGRKLLVIKDKVDEFLYNNVGNSF
ncbi:MAG: helix-turn-helix domain-containing protein [Peptostreptococcaceae bacterium]|jgi:excisionase family DNA binding protein|nr:helix-turn-helix domain-containing protein [Peptostreptococcaceae bacterium]